MAFLTLLNYTGKIRRRKMLWGLFEVKEAEARYLWLDDSYAASCGFSHPRDGEVTYRWVKVTEDFKIEKEKDSE